jgi:hypothetical protein
MPGPMPYERFDAWLAYLLRFARDGQFLTDEAWARLQKMRDKAAMLTWRLARSLATSK